MVRRCGHRCAPRSGAGTVHRNDVADSCRSPCDAPPGISARPRFGFPGTVGRRPLHRRGGSDCVRRRARRTDHPSRAGTGPSADAPGLPGFVGCSQNRGKPGPDAREAPSLSGSARGSAVASGVKLFAQAKAVGSTERAGGSFRPFPVVSLAPGVRLRVVGRENTHWQILRAVCPHQAEPRRGRGTGLLVRRRNVMSHESARTTLLIQGAREHNLRNVTVELPRDKLVVITGVSGSGKSSLAFDTLYAEGQRRLLASMSSYAKRFVNQLRKPDVDFVHGLSPVISIDQKTVGSNPRSTVGTMTDLWDYLRMLYATLGTPHCPRCGQPVPVRSTVQMVEHLLCLPRGTEVEVRAPVFEIFGEDWEHVFEQVRLQGYRRVRIDGEAKDLGSHFEIGEEDHPWIEAILDRFVVAPGIDRQVLASLEHGLKVGDGFLSFHPEGLCASATKAFWKGLGCAEHHLLSARLHHAHFTFNDPSGACRTCAGLGTSKRECTFKGSVLSIINSRPFAVASRAGATDVSWFPSAVVGRSMPRSSLSPFLSARQFRAFQAPPCDAP